MSPSTATTPEPSPLSNSSMYADSNVSASSAAKKATATDPKRYSCQFCSRAFSRSEHRSRHERSHTKERPFKCLKCRSTFVRRDLLLRHDRTVHAKDGGVPLQTVEPKRRNGNSSAVSSAKPSPLAESMSSSINGHEYSDDAHYEHSSAQTQQNSSSYLGLEEAAMLMTNFQQKAAMTASPADTGQSSATHSVYSPSLPSAQRPHWDPALTSQSYDESRTPIPPYELHSNKTSNLSLPSLNSDHQQNNIDPAISGQSYSFRPSSQPSLDGKPSISTARVSGLATPESFSPRPSLMTGPNSPSTDAHPNTAPGTLPTVTLIKDNAHINQVLADIERCRNDGLLPDAFQLPELPALNRYLSAYFGYFHPHMPFLHLPSFDPAHVCAPLLLSILSIGALYTFEQDHAYTLHIGSKILVHDFLQKVADFSSRKSPLWAMQATLLNMMFASWSGDIRGLEWSCSIKSLVANMVAGNRYELKLRSQARSGPLSHREWIEDEECRRTYFAVYIFFGLLTLTFNHTPAISFNEFDALELPSSETIWNLPVSDDASVWREKLDSAGQQTFKDAHHSLFQGTSTRYSAFATRIMINALFLEVWYHKRSPEALQDIVTEYKLRLALDTWHKSLELCDKESVVPQLGTPGHTHPLLFNAMAMYRNTTVRLVVDMMGVQEALRYHNSYEVASAMTAARDKVNRSNEMLKAVQACFDCIEVAAAQGIRWVARTSATKWSIEHALCGLDLILILSHWLWRVEHDEQSPTQQERAMYEKLQGLFDEDLRGTTSKELGSTVARLWGSMIDEVVVWGITKLMGESFKCHAQALSDSEETAQALSSMASQQHEQTRIPV